MKPAATVLCRSPAVGLTLTFIGTVRAKTIFTKLKQRSCIKIELKKVVVHKNIFTDCVKHVAMQRYHTPQWYDGLKRFEMDGLPFRTTSHVKNNTVQLLASLLNADRRCTTRELTEYITKLCSTFSTTFWVTANFQRIGFPMKFPRCNNVTAM